MNHQEYHDDELALTLSSPHRLLHQPHPLRLSANHPLIYPPENLHFPPPPPMAALGAAAASPVTIPGPVPGPVPSRSVRARRNPTLREGQSEIVNPPYPWATTQRATVHSLNYLVSNQILIINGDVQCKRCESRFTIEYNLTDKFNELAAYIADNKNSMHDRAPAVWKNPVLPRCTSCGQENSCKPVIASKKKYINWLFLLLGQMLGCCTLDQLKYFCKHTKNHRTGAKDRVLYLTYLGLCKQLDPNGPFDVRT